MHGETHGEKETIQRLIYINHEILTIVSGSNIKQQIDTSLHT